MTMPTAPALLQTSSNTKLRISKTTGTPAFVQVPYELNDDLKWNPDATSEDFTPYSDGLATRRVVKTGLSATLEVTVAGSATNATVKVLCEAGDAINEGSRVFFELTLADGTVHAGTAVVMPAKPVTGPRNIFKRTFMLMCDGAYSTVYPLAGP